MLKVLAAVLAVLSAAISITIYTATLPEIQKQAEDNAAAIEQNAAELKDVDENLTSIDNSVDGLNTRVETLENNTKYTHFLRISTEDQSYLLYVTIINDNNTPFTETLLKQYLQSLNTEYGFTYDYPATGFATVTAGKTSATYITNLSGTIWCYGISGNTDLSSITIRDTIL